MSSAGCMRQPPALKANATTFRQWRSWLRADRYRINNSSQFHFNAQRLTSCRASFRRERKVRSWSATERNCWIIEPSMFKLKCAFFRGTLPAESPEYPYTQLWSIPFRREWIRLAD